MLAQTKTAQALVTVIDLASKAYTDVCEFGPVRDYKTVRILSRRSLPYSAIQNVIAKHPGYCVVGITENPMVDEF